MSDELQRRASDDETQDEDVEAHRKSVGASDDDSDDVEAHRKAGGA